MLNIKPDSNYIKFKLVLSNYYRFLQIFRFKKVGGTNDATWHHRIARRKDTEKEKRTLDRTPPPHTNTHE